MPTLQWVSMALLIAYADVLALTSATEKKLKVLCLHGYAQNAEIFRDRSGGFRKPLRKNMYEMHYVDGLFGCTKDGEDEAEADADPLRRAWWRGSSAELSYKGWDESHQLLTQLWLREGFDGVIGFSQGAAAAAMLCAEWKPMFGMFVSGFVPRDRHAAAALLAGVRDVPTLHVFGESDELVTPERSRALADLFDGASIIVHEGGHMIPSSAHVRTQVFSFLDSVTPSLLDPLKC